MPFVQAKCESCGGILSVDSSRKTAKCPFCGSDYIVQDSINYYNSVTNIGQMYADVVQVSDESSSEGRLKAADAYLKLGKYTQAFSEYKTVTELAPQNYRGWLGLVEAFTYKYEMPISNLEDLDLLEDCVKSVKILAPAGKGELLTAPYREYINKNISDHLGSIENNLITLEKQINEYEQLGEQEQELGEAIRLDHNKYYNFDLEINKIRLFGGHKRYDMGLILAISLFATGINILIITSGHTVLPIFGWLFIIAGVAWFLYLKYAFSIEKRTILQEQDYLDSNLNKKKSELSDISSQRPNLLNEMYQNRKSIDVEYIFIQGILSRIPYEESIIENNTALKESIDKVYRRLKQLKASSNVSKDTLEYRPPIKKSFDIGSLGFVATVAGWVVLTIISICFTVASHNKPSKGIVARAYPNGNPEVEETTVSTNSASELEPEIRESIKAKWNSNSVADFKDETVFEKALNDGENVVGKTVTFTVKGVRPGTAWGVNLWAGEHLNFYSEEEVGIEGGEKITVLITYSEQSLTGVSHLLKYVLLEKVGGKPQRDGFKSDGSNKSIVIATNSIELPSYFEEAQVDNTKNSFFTYAERGQSLVYFDVRLYTDFSNFNDLNANKEKWMETFMKGFVGEMNGEYSKTVFTEHTVNAGIGIIAKNDMSANMSSDMTIYATNTFFFLPVKDGCLVFMISTSDQSTWSYASDFEKIINSVKYT